MSRRNVRTGQEKPHVTLLHLLLRKWCPRYECIHRSFSTCSALLGRITVQSQLGKMYIRDEQWKIINNKKQEGNFVNKSLLTDKKHTETTMGAHLGEHHSFTSHRTFKVAISLQQKEKKNGANTIEGTIPTTLNYLPKLCAPLPAKLSTFITW